ncbi:hypothetical protein [Rhizobium sp. BR 314]|uniref:hypothetical protein n=1 Tax=Rhizobium sp. BR 314 TaxID=3040013 RepID=UPI0039BF6BE0
MTAISLSSKRMQSSIADRRLLCTGGSEIAATGISPITTTASGHNKLEVAR